MTHEEFTRAASYWKVRDADNARMDHDELMKAIFEYLSENDTCALATGKGDFIRCTPIEYTYHDNAFWMFTEGGEKFTGLEENKNVCIAIFDKFKGFGKLKGLQVSGTAVIIEPFSDEYITAAGYRKIPLEALKKMPLPMNLIKITPVKFEFLNSDFKSKGYSSRQMLEIQK